MRYVFIKRDETKRLFRLHSVRFAIHVEIYISLCINTVYLLFDFQVDGVGWQHEG